MTRHWNSRPLRRDVFCLGSLISALKSRQIYTRQRQRGKYCREIERSPLVCESISRQRAPATGTSSSMENEAYEIRLEYEEEVEVHTELRVETRDSTGCPLHRRRWYRRRGATRPTGQQGTPRHCDRGQSHPQGHRETHNGKSLGKSPNTSLKPRSHITEASTNKRPVVPRTVESLTEEVDIIPIVRLD